MNIKERIMKHLKIYILFAIVALVASCSTEEKLTVELQENPVRGAIVRTISQESTSFDIINPETSFWAITVEEQDHEDGDLLSSLDVLVNFVDTTPANGTTTTTETMVTTIPASEFSKGPNGLPRTSFSITFTEVLSTLGLTSADYDGGDQINIRFVLNLTDGRSITNTDLTGTVSGGSFFSSPLNYRANLVCSPAPPAAGDWTFDMVDAYGDGWNGASLTVTLDGVAMDFLVDATEGSASVETLTVPTGSEVISIQFNSGAWDGEVDFTVTSANGNVILSQEAYSATTPTAGIELINYCILNY